MESIEKAKASMILATAQLMEDIGLQVAQIRFEGQEIEFLIQAEEGNPRFPLWTAEQLRALAFQKERQGLVKVICWTEDIDQLRDVLEAWLYGESSE